MSAVVRSALYESFESGVGRTLYTKLEKIKYEHAMSIAAGGMRRSTADDTAQAYADAIGYMRALNHLQGWLRDAEDEVIGRKPKSQPAINT